MERDFSILYNDLDFDVLSAAEQFYTSITEKVQKTFGMLLIFSRQTLLTGPSSIISFFKKARISLFWKKGAIKILNASGSCLLKTMLK